MGNSSGMYLNPALAGELKGFGVNTNYRNQWPNISGNYVTSLIGIQKRFNKIGLGTGINFIHDNAANGMLLTSGIGIVVSKWFKINEKTGISWGLNSSFYNKYIDINSLTSGDQIDAKLGFTGSNSDPNLNSTTNYFNFSTGFLLKYPVGNTGIVVSNFNQPNQSFYTGGLSRLPARFTLHNTTDYTLNKTLGIKLSHTVIANYQADFFSLITYATTQYKWVKVCAGYSLQNSIITGAGVSFPQFSINYIYETTISSLTNATGGAHEVALNFRFGNKKDYSDRGVTGF